MHESCTILSQSTKRARWEVKCVSVGMKLKALRAGKKKTQQEAANELKITKSALAMYEKDNRVPRDEIKTRIAAYYGESVQSIFFSE